VVRKSGGRFLKIPERKDFLRYAENDLDLPPEVQKAVLTLLASSSTVRKEVAELKRDLYLVDVQVPDFLPTVEMGVELAKLSDTWVSLLYKRQFSLKNFYRSREFFHLLLFVGGVLALLLLGVGISII